MTKDKYFNILPKEDYAEHLKTFNKNSSIIDYIRHNYEKGDPFHILDLDKLEYNYDYLTNNLPDYRCHTAIKANPSEPVLKKLYQLGSNVDVASMEELIKWFEAAAHCDNEQGNIFDERSCAEAASKVIMSNPYVETTDLVYALKHGVKRFVFASKQQIERMEESYKIARINPKDINCIIRIAPSHNSNSFQQFSESKYPVSPDYAHQLIQHAQTKGFSKFGISFHVGFQTPDASAWENTFNTVKKLIISIQYNLDIKITTVDTGGGIPAIAIGNNNHDRDKEIFYTLNSFKKQLQKLGVSEFIFEPGNSMMSSAGLTLGSVVDMDKLMTESEYNNIKLNHATDKLPIFIRLITNIGSFNSGIRDFLRPVYLIDKESGKIIPLYGQCDPKDSVMKDSLVFIGDTTCDDTGSLSKNGDYITQEAYKYLIDEISKCDIQRTFLTGHEKGIGVLVTGTGSYGFSYASLNFNSKKPLTTYYIKNQQIMVIHEHPIPTSEKIAREKVINEIENLRSQVEDLKLAINKIQNNQIYNETMDNSSISQQSFPKITEDLVNRRANKTKKVRRTSYVGGYIYNKILENQEYSITHDTER